MTFLPPIGIDTVNAAPCPGVLSTLIFAPERLPGLVGERLFKLGYGRFMLSLFIIKNAQVVMG